MKIAYIELITGTEKGHPDEKDMESVQRVF